MLGYLTILSILAVGVLGRPELYIRCHDGERFDDVTMKCVPELLRSNEARAKPNCPFNQTQAIVIPHESDCGKFYYCVNGLLTVINCPAGTEFDPTTGACNWPSEGGCYSKTTTTTAPTTVTVPTTIKSTTPETVEPTTEDCETTVVVTTSPSPDTTTTAVPPKPICVGNATSIIPSPTECDKFYVCFNGQATEYHCENGNEFDPISKDCVPISTTGCFASQATTTIKPTTPEPTTPVPTTPEPTTQTPTTLPPPVCPQNTTSVSVIPSPFDCDKFYICSAGTATEYTCSPGTEFNPATKNCLPISPEGCFASQVATTTKPTTPTPTTEKPATSAPTTEQPLTTEEPSSPAPTTEKPTTPALTTEGPSSPAPTTEKPTTPALSTERPSSPAPTTEQPTTPALPTEGPSTPAPTTQGSTTVAPQICPQNTTSISFVPSPSGCDKFYICVAGSGIEYTCESGKEFDPVSKDCVPISSTGCFASQMTTTPEPTTQKPTTLPSSTEESTTPAPTTEKPTTQAPTTEPPMITDSTSQAPTTIPPPICPQNTTSISFVPSPAGCDKFYICVAGSGIEYTCEAGKEFNPDTKDCVPISSTGCFASQMSTTPGPTTLAPTTERPTTPAPTTENPTTAAPITEIPTTQEPTTLAPATERPTTLAPTTERPTTPAQTTEPPMITDSTSQAPTTIPPPICPQNTTSISFVPSPAGCDKFYICVAGSGIEYTCEAGKEFNPDSKDCVPISSTGCFASQMTTTSEPSTPEPTTPVPTTPEPTTQRPTTIPPPICPQNTTSISFVPSPAGCDKFYICVAGSGIEYTCEAGKEFDPTTKDCVPISSNGCFANQGNVTPSPLPPMPTSEAPCSTSCKSTTAYWPDSENCRNYWKCQDGVPVSEACVVGLLFDSIINQCTYSVLANCSATMNNFYLA